MLRSAKGGTNLDKGRNKKFIKVLQISSIILQNKIINKNE
jgi:hypothetical protein